MSIPAVTPAAVASLPSNTTRSGTTSTPSNRSSSSSACQLLVARLPSSSPAAARINEPVQTEHVHCEVSCAARNQVWTGPSSISATWPGPPGTSTISGCCSSASEASAISASGPGSVLTETGMLAEGECPPGFGSPACSATNVTFAPGNRLSTS